MAYIVRGGGTGAIAGTGSRYEIHSYPPVKLELKQNFYFHEMQFSTCFRDSRL